MFIYLSSLLLFFPILLFGYIEELSCGCGSNNDVDTFEIRDEIVDFVKESRLLQPHAIPTYPHKCRPPYYFHSSSDVTKIKWDLYSGNVGGYSYSTLYRNHRIYIKGEQSCFNEIYSLDSYLEFLKIFSGLEADIQTIYQGEIKQNKLSLRYFNKRIKSCEKQLQESDKRSWQHRADIKEYTKDKTKAENLINKFEKKYFLFRQRLESMQHQAHEAFLKIFDYCIEHHQERNAYYYRGLLYFNYGLMHRSLEDVIAYINGLSPQDDVASELYHLEGQCQIELGQNHEAIKALSNAIEINPKDYKIYVDRASAYFELGEFDRSLEDYIMSKQKPSCFLDPGAFGLGVTKGIVLGGATAINEFVPSTLASLQGLGHGLWAFAKDPINISTEFAKAATDCIEYVKDHTSKELLETLVPEFQEVCQNWEGLNLQQKGELTGYIIGKYGTDIFASVGVVKGFKVYQDLKKANHMLTLEAMAISKRNQTLIKLEAVKRANIRKKILSKANLKIQGDKQGKHIVGHRNYKASINKSIFEHPEPERLVNKFAGKGIKETKITPGTSGYQEVVDFKEFIGYVVDRNNGRHTTTTWGKIHYAKDGVHIVPTKPR